mmetsp:Transcript_13732/g.28992  ORF Transcript_13732/g.28992 Transcript_13732/m.28992 type:complete len:303 (+) Transcript_13732:177-1085(+)
MAVPVHESGLAHPNSVIMSASDIESRTTSEPAKIAHFDGYAAFEEDNEGRGTTAANRISCLGFFYSIGDWYGDLMERNPVRTKCVTAGFLAAFADAIAQLIENSTNLREGATEFDQRRTLAMFVEGSCVSGPILHYAFELYEHVFPICFDDCSDGMSAELGSNPAEYLESPPACTAGRSEWAVPNKFSASRRKLLNAFLHVAFDQIFMAFIYVGALMIVTALLEGHGDQLAEELENDYFKAVQASWVASLGLAPIQIIAFRFLPTRYRVLAVNLQDVAWVCVMSYVTHRNREPTYVNDEDII